MPHSTEALIGLAILVSTPFAIAYYARIGAALKREGGKVQTGWVGSPDLVMALTLGGGLAGLALEAFARSANATQDLKPEQVNGGMIFLAVLGLGVLGFLAVRRISLLEAFGFLRVSVPAVIGRAAVMLTCAVPVLMLFGAATLLLLKDQAQEQELVTLFNKVARTGDAGTVFKIFFAGIVVAPVCEELLFRGYFYPVAKRYLGPIVGGILAAALFSASHANLASFLSLLALALTFTMSYEKSGSLLVPMCMHALFNAANLLVLYARAQGSV